MPTCCVSLTQEQAYDAELCEAKSSQLFSAPQLGTFDPVGPPFEHFPGVMVLLDCSFSAISADMSSHLHILTQCSAPRIHCQVWQLLATDDYFCSYLRRFKISDWRGGLVVKSTYCSCRGSRFNFYHPCSSQLYLQSRRSYSPLLASSGHQACTRLYIYSKISIHIKKSNLKEQKRAGEMV